MVTSWVLVPFAFTRVCLNNLPSLACVLPVSQGPFSFFFFVGLILGLHDSLTPHRNYLIANRDRLCWESDVWPLLATSQQRRSATPTTSAVTSGSAKRQPTYRNLMRPFLSQGPPILRMLLEYGAGFDDSEALCCHARLHGCHARQLEYGAVAYAGGHTSGPMQSTSASNVRTRSRRRGRCDCG
jgi:hypothetical protein